MYAWRSAGRWRRSWSSARISVRGGAALGAGLGAVELGLLAVDITNGFQVSDGSEAGAWLALAGLGFGAAGVLVTASTVTLGAPRAPRRRSSLLMILATFAVVLAYLPSWDKWTAVAPSLHVSGSVTEGNAFAQPAVVMACVLLTVVGFAFVTVLGSVWSPTSVGVWATAGAVIAISSQLISAVFQLSEAVPSTAFGVSATQARSVGLKTSTSLTGWWEADVAATVLLAALALSAALRARKATSSTAMPSPHSGPLRQRFERDRRCVRKLADLTALAWLLSAPAHPTQRLPHGPIVGRLGFWAWSVRSRRGPCVLGVLRAFWACGDEAAGL